MKKILSRVLSLFVFLMLISCASRRISQQTATVELEVEQAKKQDHPVIRIVNPLQKSSQLEPVEGWVLKIKDDYQLSICSYYLVKNFLEKNIVIQAYTGEGYGAVIAALLASDVTVNEVRWFVRKYLKRKKDWKSFVNNIFKSVDIVDLPRAFVAVDGKKFLWRGSIGKVLLKEINQVEKLKYRVEGDEFLFKEITAKTAIKNAIYLTQTGSKFLFSMERGDLRGYYQMIHSKRNLNDASWIVTKMSHEIAYDEIPSYEKCVTKNLKNKLSKTLSELRHGQQSDKL